MTTTNKLSPAEAVEHYTAKVAEIQEAMKGCEAGAPEFNDLANQLAKHQRTLARAEKALAKANEPATEKPAKPAKAAAATKPTEPAREYRFQNVGELVTFIAHEAKKEGVEPKAVDEDVVGRIGQPVIDELKTRVPRFPNKAFVTDVRRAMKAA
jgi:hypothetical protein